ncbi:glycosyltransferase [uncultured Methylobacterium sp.]|uniref:glycosyltransferase n=1 Tax=uncultured Methylobacterium sp. TaxID=157278 RepID=UPI002593EEBE|nr:glycosyltransferase [uncultured Methylobacterium sp.]
MGQHCRIAAAAIGYALPPTRLEVDSEMIFMYWTGTDVGTPPAAAAWRNLYSDFRVFTDEAVVPLLPDAIRPIYGRIRLPSAKSDLARLLLLREFGGLYIDAHVGPTSPADLVGTLDKMFEYDMILFGKGWLMTDPHHFDLMNGVLAARRHARALDVLVSRITSNIVEQWRKEKNTAGYEPYDLFSLSGTYTIVQSYFEQISPRPQIKDEFKNSIFVHFMKDNKRSGFEIAAYYNYRKPGGHWSERQTRERYFLD